MVSEGIIHLTTVYSTALLSAVLPHISDYAEKLDLPIERPIAMEQVASFSTYSQGRARITVTLTNQYSFTWSSTHDNCGTIEDFFTPKNYFFIQEIEDIPLYFGTNTMTTNEIVTFAREIVQKLGYSKAVIDPNVPPKLVGPTLLDTGEMIPQANVSWNFSNDPEQHSEISLFIDTEKKSLKGMIIVPTIGVRPHIGTPLQLAVKPDAEKYFLQRTQGTLTNQATSKTEKWMQITPTYSNALLKLILPRISDFAEKVELNVETPIRIDQVKHFRADPLPGKYGGTVDLKNGARFVFDPDGFVGTYSKPGFFSDWDYQKSPSYYRGKPGKSEMNTNEILSFTQNVFSKLGYPNDLTRSDSVPTLEGPLDDPYSGVRIPYCLLSWSSENSGKIYSQMEVDVQEKELTGFWLNPSREGRNKIGVPLKMEIPLESLFVHITPTCSNALLKAVLPHISDFAQKLDLPLKPSLTEKQVLSFRPSQIRGEVAGSVELTNHFWFEFDKAGYVSSFRSPDNYFFAENSNGKSPPSRSMSFVPSKDLFAKNAKIRQFAGKTRMTTNSIISLATKTLKKSGFESLISTNCTPTLEGPYTLPGGIHLPYCRVAWDLNPGNGYSEEDCFLHVEINTQEKTIVGFCCILPQKKYEELFRPLRVPFTPGGLPEYLSKERSSSNLIKWK